MLGRYDWLLQSRDIISHCTCGYCLDVDIYGDRWSRERRILREGCQKKCICEINKIQLKNTVTVVRTGVSSFADT